MKHPKVVEVKRREIRQVRRSGSYVIRRWYVTLSFGGVRKKLAVSWAVVRWIKDQKKRSAAGVRGWVTRRRHFKQLGHRCNLDCLFNV